MAILQREIMGVFAGGSDNPADFGVIGSFAQGTGVVAQSAPPLVSEVAGTQAFGDGLSEVVEQGNLLPALEEFNSLLYAITKQLKYLFQEGIPEWASGETYAAGSFVKYNGVIYVSQQDNNAEQPPSASWVDYLAGITQMLSQKQDSLSAGAGIDITDNVISSTSVMDDSEFRWRSFMASGADTDVLKALGA